MTGKTLILAGALALGIGAAPPHRYDPAPEAIPAELSDSDGTTVAAQCGSCHSLDYITTQPRDKGAQFWRDEVTKMVNVYKAPLAPADADVVAAVLARKFGNS